MADVYTISTKIEMINRISPVLGQLVKELVHLEGKIGNIGKSFEAMGLKAQVVLGGGTAAAGIGIIGGLVKATEHASKLLHVQNQLAISGISIAEQAQATAKALELQQKYGVKYAEALSDIREIRFPLGSMEHALAFAEPLEQMRVVLNAFKEGTGDKAKESLYAAARGGELRGLKTNEDFRNLFDAETKAIIATGGKLTPEGFLAAAQYGRVATQGWSPEFVEKWLPTLIQEQRGMQAGTGLMSLFRNIAQGHTPLGSVQALDEYGLLTDPSKLIMNKKGEVKGFHYGAVEQSDLLVKDPYKWAQEVLAPALRKKFGDDISPSNPKVIGALGDLISQRTAAQSAAIMTLQPQRFEKDAALIGQTMGLGAADILVKRDPYAAMNRFTAAWDALLTKLGGPLVDPSIKALNGLADAINKMSGIEHITGLARSLTELGAASLVGGLAAMVAGPAGGLIAALVVALGALAVLNWGEITAGFDKIKEAITGFWDWLKEAGAGMLKWITSLGGLLKTSLSNGGIGGGGGLINASYGDGSGASIGGSPHGSYLQYANMIKQYGGDEAENLMKIYRVEGPQGYAHGDSGMSYGPFQVYTGGGIGNQMLRAGINVRDPGSVRAQIEWMKNYGHRTGGYSQEIWHGLRDKHIGSLRSGSRVSPYRAGRGQQEVHVHSPVYLDGKMIASNTVTHILKSSEHSRQSAYFDGYHSFAGADRQTATA